MRSYYNYYITPAGRGWAVYTTKGWGFQFAGLLLGDMFSSGAMATLNWLGTQKQP